MKAHVHVREGDQAPAEQRRAHYQRDSERDLRHDERLSRPPAASAERGPLAALSQAIGKVDTRDVPRRRKAEDNTCGEGNAEGKQQRGRIHGDFADAGQVLRDKGDQRADAPARDDHAADSRHQCKHDALRQHLPDEPRPPRAHGCPHHELAPARRGACEQQVGDVRAGDQQHECDGPEQHQQRLPRIADHNFLDRHHGDAFLGIGERILLRQPRGDAGHLRLRLRHGDAGGQVTDTAIVVRGTRHRLGRIRIRVIDIGAGRITRRGDADDRVRALFKRDRRSDRAGIRREPVAPVGLTEDDGIGVRRFFFVRRE